MKRNLWPLGLAVFILAGIGIIVFAIKFSLSNPVQLENEYFQKSQIVDENADRIIFDQNSFDTEYIAYIEIGRAHV